MRVSISALTMLFQAADSLRSGESVLIVAYPRPYALRLGRILKCVTKRMGIVCGNHAGVPLDAPWIFVRSVDEIAPPLMDVKVFRDISASHERPVLPPAQYRQVQV